MSEKWKLDDNKISKFRNIFNNEEFADELIKIGSWDQICAAMDSIDVGVTIVNLINTGNKHHHFALELIELFTAGQMIKEGVFRMNKALFNKDYSLKDDNSVFQMQNMTDDKTFSEYRALSFAHSVEFGASNMIAKGTKSYFSWLFWDCINNKIAMASRYPDLETIKINFDDVFNYIEKRYNYLDIIEEEIIAENNLPIEKDDNFSNIPLPNIEIIVTRN